MITARNLQVITAEPEEQRLSRPTQFTMRTAGTVSQPLRLFEVSGEDEDGTIHSFHTDNAEQAAEIADIFRQDLACVQIVNHTRIGLGLLN